MSGKTEYDREREREPKNEIQNRRRSFYVYINRCTQQEIILIEHKRTTESRKVSERGMEEMHGCKTPLLLG